MENLLLVNKKHRLNRDFTPDKLVIVEDGIESGVDNKLPQITDYVLKQFVKLQNKALEYNHKIFINSGYRSYEQQKKLTIDFLNRMDFEEALSLVAPPGTSEHQTGLALDFAVLKSIEDNHKHYVRGVDMWQDEATKWVHKNAHLYGFILRFPKDKEKKTLQKTEPWHLRYVGVEVATFMKENNLCLEEYLKEDEYIPLIGVVGRVVEDSGDNPVIATGEYYRKALSRNNASVITIQPPQDIVYNETRPRNAEKLTESEKKRINRILEQLDGIVFPGGSKWYEFDEYIVKYALDKKMPMFGICLGMQTIAYVDNKEVSDPALKTYHNDSDIEHHQIGPEYVHAVNIKAGSVLYDLLGKQDTIMVNSRHSYNIGGITNRMKIYGYSPDGISEYGELGNHVIAAQWHPELMAEYDNNNKKMFEYFVEMCRNYENK